MWKLLNFLNSEVFWTFLKVLIIGSAFVGGVVLAMALMPDEKQAAARKRLGVSDDKISSSRLALLRWLRPFINALVPYVAQRQLGESRKDIHKKLLSANLREELTPDEFIAFKIVLAMIIPILIIYITGAIGEPLPGFLWPAAIIGGYYFGDLWLSQRISIRRRAIIRSMPYTLDLLTLSVEAGLDFIAAIQRLTQKAKDNALLIEFNHMLREIRLGTARSDALRSLSDRLQIEEITSFTTLLIQADQLGASIGNVLRAQSDQLRTQRFQAAEAAGAKASQLILFPLILCIFPSIFIIVLGPTILSFLRGGFF